MKGNVYNLGNDEANTTKKELVELICNYSGASYSEVQNRTDPDKRDYVVSSKKLYDIGYRPVMSLDAGVKEMLNFFTYLSSDGDIRDTQTSYMFNYKWLFPELPFGYPYLEARQTMSLFILDLDLF